MIELPEAATLASQLTEAVEGKRIATVVAAHSPHKFAWFHGDPDAYEGLLSGKTVGAATSHGSFVSEEVEDARLLFVEGVVLRLLAPGDSPPAKHQLLIGFADSYALCGSVRMYGGLYAYPEGQLENPYFEAARSKPSPLSDDFDGEYFENLIGASGVQRLSLKAFLAAEQRIPGLGNGVLQDILFEAALHPKRKVASLEPAETSALLGSIRTTLAEMSRLGGRDTETDLFGNPGGYTTKLSRFTLGQQCPRCGGTIEKSQYLGGAIYYCAGCQELGD